jgi:hypothetical protein
VEEIEVPTDSKEKESDESDKDNAKGCNYGMFKRCNPASFDGTQDASAA